jgi:hypothetical protein
MTVRERFVPKWGGELVGRRYRHYKGGEYVVVGFAIHSETKEQLIVYRNVNDQLWQMWARPVLMFFGDVEVDGKRVDRFAQG